VPSPEIRESGSSAEARNPQGRSGQAGNAAPAFGEDTLGYAAEFADEAKPGEYFQGVEGDVDLPPVEALAGTGHVVVVVVVPSLAKGDEGEEPVVFARVRGRKAALAEEVGERIDGKRTVPEENGAQEEAPGEQAPAAHEEQGDGEDGGGHQVVLVEPAKFGKLGEVADVVEARVVEFVGKNPADMRPPKPEERGRVEVLLLVRETVVMAMMGGPPEDTLLRGRHGHPGDDKLEPAAGLEGAVGEIAVIAGGDEEHADFVEEDAGDEIGPAKLNEEDAEGGEMDHQKGYGRNQLKASAIG